MNSRDQHYSAFTFTQSLLELRSILISISWPSSLRMVLATGKRVRK